MAVLAVHNKKTKQAVNWLDRLALLKLAYHRLGDDTFAIEERFRKARLKFETLKEGTDEYDEIYLYLVNLELMRNLFISRRENLQKTMAAVAVYNLDKAQYRWYTRMEPVSIRSEIPEHMQYLLGTTKKSIVHYERISGVKRVKEQIMWNLSPLFFTFETPHSEGYSREFTYGQEVDFAHKG